MAIWAPSLQGSASSSVRSRRARPQRRYRNCPAQRPRPPRRWRKRSPSVRNGQLKEFHRQIFVDGHHIGKQFTSSSGTWSRSSEAAASTSALMARNQKPSRFTGDVKCARLSGFIYRSISKNSIPNCSSAASWSRSIKFRILNGRLLHAAPDGSSARYWLYSQAFCRR